MHSDLHTHTHGVIPTDAYSITLKLYCCWLELKRWRVGEGGVWIGGGIVKAGASAGLASALVECEGISALVECEEGCAPGRLRYGGGAQSAQKRVWSRCLLFGPGRLGPFGRDWARHCICRQASTTLLMSAGNRSGHSARPRPAPAPLGTSGGTEANAGRQFR